MMALQGCLLILMLPRYYTQPVVSMDDDDAHIHGSFIPFCRHGHSQSTLRIMSPIDRRLVVEERVYVFGGEGVGYEHYLETKYLNDMWELSVIVSDDGLNRSRYLFEWSQVDRRAAVVWPSGRSHFGHTVLQLDNHSMMDSSSPSSFDDYLLVFGGENDDGDDDDDDDGQSMRRSRGGDSSNSRCTSLYAAHRRSLLISRRNKGSTDDVYIGEDDDETACMHLLGDLWLFSHNHHFKGREGISGSTY